MKKVYCGITCLALSAAMVMSSVPVNVMAMVDEDIILSTDEGALVIQEDTETLSDKSSNDLDGIISDDKDSTSLLESTGKEAEINDAEALNVSEDRELTDNSNVLTDSDVVNNSTDELKDETVDMVEEDAPNMLGTSDVVTTDWYSAYYNYEKDDTNRKLILKSSTGKYKQEGKSEVFVPAKTQIGSAVYTTYLDNENRNNRKEQGSEWGWDNNCLWAKDKDFITKLTIAEGVIAGSCCESLFANMTALTTLDVKGLDTSNATNMHDMFRECSKLTALDLSGFDTSKVTNMSHMFEYCCSIVKLDLRSFNTSAVNKYMTGMFNDMYALEEINVSSFDTSHIKYMNWMFGGCHNLKKLDLSNFDTSQVETMNSMFCGCWRLESLNVSKFNTSNVTDMSHMFQSCGSLQTLNVSSFDTSKVTDMSYMFCDCQTIKKLDLSNFNTSAVTNMSTMFGNMQLLEEINVSSFDTRNVADMSHMFQDCPKLKKLDLSSFRTLSVRDFTDMFLRTSGLTSLDIRTFLFSPNAITLNMLYNLALLENLYLSDSTVSNYDFTAKEIPNLKHIYYCGSQADWNALKNKVLSTTTVHCKAAPNDKVEAFVVRLYKVALGRLPDQAGLDNHVKRLKSKEQKGAQVVGGFYLSAEMDKKNLSNTSFVENAYRGIMGRDADAGGKTNWVDALNSGASHRYVVCGFVKSDEFKNLCRDYGIDPGTLDVNEYRDKNIGITRFCSRLYTEALGRGYDVGGLNNWCGNILSNKSRANVIKVAKSFFNSPEYKNKNRTNEQYVTDLYKTFLGRNPDAGGKANWVNHLSSKRLTRDQVLESFANSAEFSNIMKKYGL